MLKDEFPAAGPPHALPPPQAACSHTAARRCLGVTLAKLDATIAPEIASQYGVSGYPTLVLFTADGGHENLKQFGPHNDAYMALFLAKRVLGAIVEPLSSAGEVDAFRERAEVVSVLYTDDVNSQAAQAFMSASMKLSSMVRRAPGVLSQRWLMSLPCNMPTAGGDSANRCARCGRKRCGAQAQWAVRGAVPGDG